MDTTPYPHYPDGEPTLSQIEAIIWERMEYSLDTVADLDEMIRVMVSGMMLRWGMTVDREDIEIKIRCKDSVEILTPNHKSRERINFHNLAAHLSTKAAFVSTSSSVPHDHLCLVRGNRTNGNEFTMTIWQDSDPERYA